MPILDNLQELINSGQVDDAIEAIRQNNPVPFSMEVIGEYVDWAKKEFTDFSTPKDNAIDFINKFTDISGATARLKRLDMKVTSFILLEHTGKANAKISEWMALLMFRKPDLMQRFYSWIGSATWVDIVYGLLNKGMSFDEMRPLAAFVLLERSNLPLFKHIEASLEARFPERTFDGIELFDKKIAALESCTAEFQDYLAMVHGVSSVDSFISYVRKTTSYGLLLSYLKHKPDDLIDTIGVMADALQFEESTYLYDAVDQLVEAGLIQGAQLDELCVRALNDCNINTYHAFLGIKQQRFDELNQPILPNYLNDRLDKTRLMSAADRTMYHQVMKQLTRGLRRIKATKNSSDVDSAALFVLAAIKQAKQSDYAYHPTVVNEANLVEYLNLVKGMAPPVSEKFLISGIHWNSGAIEIHDDEVNILLIDPLDEPIPEYIKACQEVFGDKKVTIYVNYNTGKKQRQYGNAGCSVFALDDVRHLHTSFRDNSLFAYLASHTKPMSEEHPGAVIHYSELPPSMQRTMQSRDAFDAADAGAVVNKKGETYLESLYKTFVHDPLRDKLINQRLESKLRSSAERVADFICRNGCSQAAVLAGEHTLQGFKHRVEQNAPAPMSIAFKAPLIEVLQSQQNPIDRDEKPMNKSLLSEIEALKLSVSSTEPVIEEAVGASLASEAGDSPHSTFALAAPSVGYQRTRALLLDNINTDVALLSPHIVKISADEDIGPLLVDISKQVSRLSHDSSAQDVSSVIPMVQAAINCASDLASGAASLTSTPLRETLQNADEFDGKSPEAHTSESSTEEHNAAHQGLVGILTRILEALNLLCQFILNQCAKMRTIMFGLRNQESSRPSDDSNRPYIKTSALRGNDSD